MESEDAFHFTAVDARRYEFGSALRGYDKARVDQFREQVADELERLARLNQDLEAKARGFHEQLRAFRERDKALNDALISAQQLRGDMKAQASQEADLIIREAHLEADKIAEGARGQLVALRGEIERLDRARRSYLAQLRILAERHLAEANAAEKAPPPQGIDLPQSNPVVAPIVGTPGGAGTASGSAVGNAGPLGNSAT
jgi:DivIVA domain-containing protein